MVALLDTSCSLLADKGQPNQGDTNRMGRPKARCGDAPSPYRTFSPCTEPPQPWSHPAQCQHALGRNQKGTPPAPRGPQPCPLLTIACASSREKCLFSLMGYCSPDRRCTHKHTHTHTVSALPIPNPCPNHWGPFCFSTPCHPPPGPHLCPFAFSSQAWMKQQQGSNDTEIKAIPTWQSLISFPLADITAPFRLIHAPLPLSLLGITSSQQTQRSHSCSAECQHCV